MTRSSRPPSTPASPVHPEGLRAHAGWILLLAAATLLAYAPALSAGLIWDDVGHVTRTDLRPLGGLFRIWFEPGATQQYYPLLHSAFWLEHRLWGDAPAGYHLLNVLLHVTNACLFALVFRRLIDGAAASAMPSTPGIATVATRPRWPGVEWLAALLYALHPVCVESVAWITEQKNTLSTALYLGAALGFLRYCEDRRRSRYLLATALFLAALLAKSVTATLPAALLVAVWWQCGRLDWRRVIRPLLPWFALGVSSGLFTAHVERTLIGAEGTGFTLNALERCLLAGRIVWFYLGKLLWPADLTFIYPRWKIDSTEVGQWIYPIAGLALLGWGFFWRRRSRTPLAVLLLFGGTLFPVLGFFNVFPFIYSFVADHFQYLAIMPFAAFAAAGLRWAMARVPGHTGIVGAGVLLVGLGALSFSRAGVYHDKIALYEDTLARNPAAWMAHTNLATELASAGRLDEALPHLRTAIRLHPNYAEGHANLGDLLLQLGRPFDAIPPLEEALRLRPNYAEAHNTLGAALVAAGRAPEGEAHYREALRLAPNLAVAHRNLGLVLAAKGQGTAAIAEFAEAARLDPRDPGAENCWGIALMTTGKPAEALIHFARVVELAPGWADGHLTYGRALASQHRLDAAFEEFRTAVELAPDLAPAHLALAQILVALGHPEEAQEEFLVAQQLGARP